MDYGAAPDAAVKGISTPVSGPDTLCCQGAQYPSAAYYYGAGSLSLPQRYNIPSNFIKYQPKSAFIAAFYHVHLYLKPGI
jgi:hypothetical protein